MEFVLRDIDIDNFVSGLNRLEVISKPFDQNIFREGEAFNRNGGNGVHPWSKLSFNTNRFGKKMFEWRVKKPEDANNPALSSIPVGNLYVEFFYMRRRDANAESVGVVDLKINDQGEITKKGIHPVFITEQSFRRVQELDTEELPVYSIRAMLFNCVTDRLRQICGSYKTAIPNPSLLAETINYVFKFSEMNPGNKYNYRRKVEHRAIFVSRNTVNKANPNGDWSFDYSTPYRRAMHKGDALNSDSAMNTDALRDMIDYFEKKGANLILGEASEEGGRKGNIVIMNPELQKLRYPDMKDEDIYHGYVDICYGQSPIKSNSQYTIYTDPAKVFARVKGFMSNDGCAAYNLQLKKTNVFDEFETQEDDVKGIFDRHRSYLSHKEKDIGKLNPTVNNLLVAYVPTEQAALDVDIDQFHAMDKNEYSKLIHGTDCHVPISQAAANIPVKVRRKITEPITENHLTFEFSEIISKLEHESQAIPADTIIGYKTTCTQCESIMYPVKVTGVTEEDEIVYEDVPASGEVADHFCIVCQNHEVKKAIPIKVSDKYQHAEGVVVHNVEIDTADGGLIMDAEIICPIQVARLTSVEGVKGLSVPMKQDFIGYVDGDIYDPNLDEYTSIDVLPVDAIVPLGSMKGKVSGMGISHVRLINALTGSRLCIDDEYARTGDMGPNSEINKVLSKTKKMKLYRKVYDVDKQKFEIKTFDAYVGIVSVDVTEIGDEFLKVKTDTDDMKVSFMNTLFYDWLGLDSLNQAMVNASLEKISDPENLEYIKELFKIFYNDITGLPEVKHIVDEQGRKHDSDFNNQNGSVHLISWLDKDEWLKVAENHPLFKQGGKFEHGAYHQDAQGNVIVFPSRKLAMKLVDVIPGGKVRIPALVKDTMSMFLSIYNNKAAPGYVNPNMRNKHKENVFKILTGKQGVLARASTFVNYGCSGKEIGSGYIPTGVAVIGNKKFWNMVRHNCETAGKDFDKIMKGDEILYGTSQRDPYIWLFQALNAIELWPVSKANRYFQEKYGFKFTEMYDNFNGVMLNTLDMLYLYQTDADGDLRRILLPFDFDAQRELKDLNVKMKNYNMIVNAEPDSTIGKIFNRVKKWHFDYVYDEVESSAKELPTELSVKLAEFTHGQRSKNIVNNIDAKGNIAIITTSQWKIQTVADLAVRTGKEFIIDEDKPKVTLTLDDRNAIALFYQTQFTQDGCVRALKNAKNLGNFTIDEIAYNRELEIYNEDTLKMETMFIRDMVIKEAEKGGYGDIAKKFIAICDWWREIGGIVMRDNKVKADVNAILPEGNMVNAYVALVNGSKFNAINKYHMFNYLVAPGYENLYEHNVIKDIIPDLKKLTNSQE